MKPLLLRVDAGGQIGWGHLTRCLALADAWRDAGGRASFAIRRDSQSTAPIDRIRSRGHRCIPINAAASKTDELCYLHRIAQTLQVSWIVLDGYHFTAEYQQEVREAAANLAVIDDTGHLPRYHADLLINSSPVADRIAYACDLDTVKLLGTQYLPLRQEILWQRRQREVPDVAARVLITLGGGDATEHQLKIIEALSAIDRRQLDVQMVVGPSNRRRTELEEMLACASGSRLKLVDATDDLPQRMAWADLAISAAGTTLWELAFLGVPTVALTLADNQQPIAEELSYRGAVLSLGDAKQVTASRIADAVTALIDDTSARRSMSAAGRNVVDGRGARRIASAIRCLELRIRPAQADDCLLVWHWANDPDSRAASFQSEPITWETHQLWFHEQTTAPDTLLLVAIDAEGNPVGQVRFSRRDEAALTSISVDREYRGQGFGTRLIRKAIPVAFERWPSVARLDAEIKASNVPSQRVFEHAGFLAQGTIFRGGAESVLFQFQRGRNS